MKNPEVSIVAINSTSPTLVFSGTGKVIISTSSNARFGGEDLSLSDAATQFDGFPGLTVEYKAPAKIYAMSFGSPGSVRVTHWF